jgi:hypothetical protein
MTTQPDDITLTQWMDGELDGAKLSQVEAWAQDHPEILAERNAVQQMSACVNELLPKSLEPPYPDFFNHRIMRTIENSRNALPTNQTSRTSRNFWQWLAIPLAAGAMAVCFYLGTRMTPTTPSGTSHSLVTTADSSNIKISPPEKTNISTIYTPDRGVQADMFQSEQATVIVLKGLQDLPDDLEMAGEPSTPSNGMMIQAKKADYTY